MIPNSDGDRCARIPSGGGRNTFWLLVTVACVIGLTSVNAYRAATQSITHDEAVTYDRYVSGPLYRLISSTDANNHILHSVLCRATVSVCGPSEFALRLPSLAGGVLFLAMLGRVGWRVWGFSPTTAAAVLVLGLNPYVMDYLSIARGYSLALGLWVAALDQLLAAWYALRSSDVDSCSGSDLHVRRASQLFALSVLANLTFVIAAFALAVCWAGCAWRVRRLHVSETQRSSLDWLWRTLVRPGAILFACLALPLVKLRPGHFYFGAASLADSLRSFVYASFAHHPQTWPWDTQSPWFLSWLDAIALGIGPVLMAALIVLWAFAARKFWHRAVDPKSRVEPGELLFYFSAGTLCLSLALLSVLHIGLGMKLPLERTGLYLLPPFCLAILSAGSALSGFAPVRLAQSLSVLPASALRGVVTVGGLLLCVIWAGQLQTGHYRPWALESDTREVFKQIVSQRDPKSKQRLRVGATWFLAPALNFYRDVYKADYIERIERQNHYPVDADLYVVASGEAGGVPPSEPVVELYRGSVSGTVVVAPARLAAAIRPRDGRPD
jgi:hypothetical protein